MAETTDAISHDEEHHFLYNPRGRVMVVDEHFAPEGIFSVLLSPPLFVPLLFPNVSSDARDHCANERTFLSWLRLSVYLAVVAAAIFVNFHLKSQPTDLERRLSHPLGYIFGVLALACLASGFANYARTVAKYAHRRALVQHGLKTQFIFGIVATAIIAACGIFLGSEAQSNRDRQQRKAL